MTKDELFEVIDYNTTTLSHNRAIKTAVEAYLSASNDAKPNVSRCLPFDGCQNCVHNKPGLEAGYWCINNCISGSMFQGK